MEDAERAAAAAGDLANREVIAAFAAEDAIP